MSEVINKVKGKIKQVAGKAAGNKRLERQGTVDEAKGKVEGAVRNAKRAIRNAARA